MNTLPQELEKIINDYVNQLIQYEKLNKVHKELIKETNKRKNKKYSFVHCVSIGENNEDIYGYDTEEVLWCETITDGQDWESYEASFAEYFNY